MISNFYKLDSKLQEMLRNKDFCSLRKIQEDSIDYIFSKNNLLIVAPTASGKTEAALLPVISSILGNKENDRYLKCLYIAPLKALLNDLESRILDLKDYGESQPFILKWHGDVSRSRKLKELQAVPDILMITPESLEVLFISKYINQAEIFEKIEFIIIDEAHNFAATPRGAQLISLINRIENLSEFSIQRIGLSATIGNPKIILNWMCSGSELESKLLVSEKAPKKFKSEIFHLENEKDDGRLLNILQNVCNDGKTIIFNNSRSFAEEIAKKLEKINIDCSVHHGSLSKFIREEAEDQIKNEAKGVISATSTLELGIDIGDLDKVVQCQSYPSVNSFLQRMGRTGRRSGKNAHILSITDNEKDFLLNLSIISLGLYDNFFEPINPSKCRYDILLQQLLSESISYYGINKDKFWDNIRCSYCFRDINKEEYSYLIKYWEEEEIIRILDESILLGEKGEKYFANRNFLELFSVFETSDQYEVIYNKFSIGVLDSWFVKSKPGRFLFRLAGKKWQVEEIDDQSKLIYVSLTTDGIPAVWMGGSVTNINYRIAQRIRDIICNEFENRLFNLNEQEYNALANIQKGKSYIRIPKSKLLITKTEEGTTIVTYAGTMINQILSCILTKNKEIRQIDCDHIRLYFKKKSITEKDIFDLLNKIRNEIDYSFVYNILIEEIKVWRYSKFAEYIPEELSKKFIISEYYDIDEFLGYIKDIDIVLDDH
jgi:ATP-dependent helicase Lhr and Lhr-like helicase